MFPVFQVIPWLTQYTTSQAAQPTSPSPSGPLHVWKVPCVSQELGCGLMWWTVLWKPEEAVLKKKNVHLNKSFLSFCVAWPVIYKLWNNTVGCRMFPTERAKQGDLSYEGIKGLCVCSGWSGIERHRLFFFPFPICATIQNPLPKKILMQQ